MEQALLLAGAERDNIDIMLPDRFIDGYGMSPRLIDRATDRGASLVITVDCGSRNHDIVHTLREHHIDTIITDHHECEDTLPEAIAIVNAHRRDFTGPTTLTNLAGVGAAFKVAEGLVAAGLIAPGQEKWLLDLVLIGTICDSMLLTGENRILTYYGIKVLEKTRRPGLRELMRSAGVTHVTSESIGFQLGPRLNAAGRLDTAELSLNLLRTTSASEAAAIALTLEDLNKKRRTEQRAATDEIAKRREASPNNLPVIVESGHWHEGIIGIVAGRLVERYHRPAFVLTEVGSGLYKGSGRSFGDFNLAEALLAARDVIEGGGGHAGAAGVQVSETNIPLLTERLNSYYASLHLADQERFLVKHADLTAGNLADFTLEPLTDLSLLEPFGMGNEEPIFRLTDTSIVAARRMGASGEHLRLDLRDRSGKTIKCVAFFAPSRWFSLDEAENYDFLIRPIENEFRGVRSIEARLLDILPVAS